MPNIRVDLNQTIKNRLKEKHGPNVGRIISECIQECIAREYTGDALKTCIKECLFKKLEESQAKAIDIDGIYDLLAHWVSVG